jgi:hypothetical protein
VKVKGLGLLQRIRRTLGRISSTTPGCNGKLRLNGTLSLSAIFSQLSFRDGPQGQTRNLEDVRKEYGTKFRVRVSDAPRNDVLLLPLILSEDVNIGTA